MGPPDHLWFIRRIRVEVRAPFLEDRDVRLVTWCSGLAAIAAAAGGRSRATAEAGSRWTACGSTSGPTSARADRVVRRLRGGDGGRPVSTRLELVAAPERRAAVAVGAARDRRRPPRSRQQRRLLAGGRGRRAVARSIEAPLAAELDYRDPIDLDDRLELPSSGTAAWSRSDSAWARRSRRGEDCSAVRSSSASRGASALAAASVVVAVEPVRVGDRTGRRGMGLRRSQVGRRRRDADVG